MGTNKQHKNNAKKQKGEVFSIEGFSFFVVDCMKVGFLTSTLPEINMVSNYNRLSLKMLI